MKLVIGSDHAGFPLKEFVKEKLSTTKGITVEDIGTDSAESVHYPVYAKKVAKKVASGEADKGIIICGSGLGVSMAANRIKGVRAALVYDAYTAIMSRKHNDANVLALGARTILPENAEIIVDLWLRTEFEGGRHQLRVDLIEED